MPIVYARQCLKRHVIQEGTQDGACLWTLAKQAAMAKAGRSYDVISRLYIRAISILSILLV